MKPTTKERSFPHTNKRKTPPKKNNIDKVPINEVKEMFMAWFKKRNSVGQIMTKQDVVQNILTKLNAKQNDALKEAMDELIKEQLIEVKEDGVTLVLTQLGSQCV